MTTHADFESFLRLLEDVRVEYMIVGGYAVAYHGFPRFTKDIDVFYSDARENTRRLQAVLVAFGFQAATVPLEVLEEPDTVLSIGLEPVRIDLLNRIAGVTFDAARANRVRGRYARSGSDGTRSHAASPAAMPNGNRPPNYPDLVAGTFLARWAW